MHTQCVQCSNRKGFITSTMPNTVLLLTEKMEYRFRIFDNNITTTLTAFPPTIKIWIGEVLRRQDLPARRIVGLDALSRPSSDPSHTNPIGTLQLCVDRHCLLFQIAQCPTPTSLVDFFENRDNCFVGVNMAATLEKLVNDYGIGVSALYADLGALAAVRYNKPELQEAGLRELANLVLGKDFVYPSASTNWDIFELTDDQVHYATVDPFVSSEIAKILLDVV